MHIDGRCHCGHVTYVAEVDPEAVSICHCTDCQVLCGSPWRASIQTSATSFRLTAAEPRIYLKTAESGRRRRQAFCGDCGTPIYSSTEHDPQSFNLRLGSIVQRAQLAPNLQHWRRSAVAWASDITGVPTGNNT
jgi:hypothetical protein